MDHDFLSPAELDACALASVGARVKVSRHALLLRPDRIDLGSDVRIDAFCVLSGSDGGVRIGDHVHLSAHTCILGRESTVIEDFCTISVRCTILSSDDDYSGSALTNPTVPDRLRGATDAPVRIGAHSIVGAGSVVLPGVTIGPSAAVGAMTLVKEDVPELAIVAGAPMRRIGTRAQEHLALARELRQEESP
jgi:acetyltransferase-like isoleucine patch superfamily enzyme